jgi:hypothetical protein
MKAQSFEKPLDRPIGLRQISRELVIGCGGAIGIELDIIQLRRIGVTRKLSKCFVVRRGIVELARFIHHIAKHF